MLLQVHQLISATRVEGPGLRACLQVQGCPIQCEGCAVPFTWAENAGISMDVDHLADRILQIPHIEGITFLGGEPFAQARALVKLGCILKKEGLSVMTFTGYILEHLQKSGNQDYLDLLAVTDILIDGPFQKARLDTSRPWVGSSNQRYHFLSDRYIHLQDHLQNIPNKLEVRIASDGRIMANGLAEIKDLENLLFNIF